MDMKRIAILFPGIGYTVDKPLLYYSSKLFRTSGWDVTPVSYSGFPDGVKGNSAKMEQAARMALDQAEEMLDHVEWTEYKEVLLVSKSIGTVVAAAYAQRSGLKCRNIMFTPVEGTFGFHVENAIAFHGTADPWAETGIIRECCEKQSIPLYITENANHSLETGEILADIRNLENVMRIVKEYVEEGHK